MPVEQINIDEFIDLAKSFPLLDVRSPGEFLHAHIPGAFSLPLFTDEQRKIIGTAYKKQGRQIAVDIGLKYFSERMKNVFDETNEIFKANKQENKNLNEKKDTLLLYCWRGGMRSSTMAWLLSLYGFKVYTLIGGYKYFRRWALAQFNKEYTLNIIGGYTGSGKTEILKKIKNEGQKAIDLEALANHKGSAFGALGEEPQPGAEMFENLLASELYRVKNHRENATNDNAYTKNENIAIWLEDESMHIGSVGIPKLFWNQMRRSRLFFLDIPFDERLKNIITCYGKYEKEKLSACILKIQKRLGGRETKNALQFLNEGRIEECFSILLHYYDKLYEGSLNNRENLHELLNKIPCSSVGINNAQKFALQNKEHLYKPML